MQPTERMSPEVREKNLQNLKKMNLRELEELLLSTYVEGEFREMVTAEYEYRPVTWEEITRK